MSKMGYTSEKVRQDYHRKLGRYSFRVSGSIGAMDLIVIEYIPIFNLYKVWLEQVKSVKGKYFYFNKRDKDEWRRLRDDFNIPSFFVINFRFKNRYHWKEIEVKGEPPTSVKWIIK